jgi:hypothetical protein
MVRTKSEESTVEEKVGEAKIRLSSGKGREKSTQSFIVDKSSFGIGFAIGSFLLCMFIVGCIIGSTVM